MVNYNVNVGGGVQAGQALKGLGDAYRQNQDRQEATAQRDKMQQLILGARKGDDGAIDELYSMNPKIAQGIEQDHQEKIARMGEAQASLSQKNTLNAAVQFMGATPEQKQELMQRFVEDESIDFGDDEVNMSPEQFDLSARLLVHDSFKNSKGAVGGVGGGQAVLRSTANEKDWRTYQDLKKSDPSSAKQFGQKVGFVSKEGRELSPYHQKQLTKYSDEAVQAETLASEFDIMADEFEQLDPVAGAAGTAFETLKEITGSEDAKSELRRKYLKIRASQVVKNLPPGAASEKDVQLALSGFPKQDANSETLASFMRGIAKIQKFQADYNNFRSEYLSSNATERGMLKAWKGRSLVENAGSLSDEDLFK